MLFFSSPNGIENRFATSTEIDIRVSMKCAIAELTNREKKTPDRNQQMKLNESRRNDFFLPYFCYVRYLRFVKL